MSTASSPAAETATDIVVQVGQGTETHYGIDLGRGILATLCGTNGRRIVKIDADDATGRPDYVTCERCNPRTA